MVGLIRFLMVIASVVSLFVLSPQKAQRMSGSALTGDVKDMREIENVQRGRNL
ncbi:MAG: hypothetical protein WAK33_24700 [Silvibacterium sp.]